MSRRTVTRVAVTGAVCVYMLVTSRLGGQAPAPPPAPPPPAVGIAVAPPVVSAGSPPVADGPLPMFEVGSVKKTPKGVTSSGFRTPGGGRITISNYPLRTVIMQAWGYRDYQVIGGPSWLTTDRFTITAKAEGNAPRDQLLLMLRSLLVERFQLKYRNEKREHTVHALIVANKDGKPSPRLKPVDCTAARAGGPPRPGQPVPCGGSIMLSSPILRLNGATMATLASLLGSLGGIGQVVDRTDLKGTYDIELEMSLSSLSSSLQAAAPGAAPGSAPTAPLPIGGDGPSVFSAVQDLGLKLERRREPIDAIVIESVQQPDDD